MHYEGLNSEQVRQAAEKGENRLAGRKKSGPAELFFSQFKDLMILILAGATVVSALMGEATEAAAIIAIVLLNALMGFLQEYRTEKTLEALNGLTAPVAHVCRGGRLVELPADRVVCGDIAVLRAGDRVPADGELLEADAFSTDEALLTGESAAVEKKPHDRAFLGTMAVSGSGVLRVTAVGMGTEMGRIASMLEAADSEKTPLQKRLQQLSKFVAAGCLFVCIGVGMLGWLRGEPFLQMLLTGISLAVAAIPEGMPAIVTIVLALSVGRILKKGAIIRRLPAVETLGCAGVICSDKTGTITQNRMSVRTWCCKEKLWSEKSPGGAYVCGAETAPPAEDTALQRLMRCAVLCGDARLTGDEACPAASGSPTETALLLGAVRAGASPVRLNARYRRTAVHPFDSVHKRMDVTVASAEGERLFLCKGAPERILEHCSRCTAGRGSAPLNALERRRIAERLHALASQGYRVLAFAENDRAADGENNLIFLGLAGLQDPPKPQVEGAVRRCRRAGMKPVMITGDDPVTAQAIARQVGIFCPGDRVLSGPELEAMSDDELRGACMRVSVYARVTPQHKLRIVRAYQNCGQVVAMTGDAVARFLRRSEHKKGAFPSPKSFGKREKRLFLFLSQTIRNNHIGPASASSQRIRSRRA